MCKLSFFLLGLCHFLFFAHSLQAQVTVKDSLIVTRFQNELTRDINQDNLHGSISALIIIDNKIVWQKAMGYRRVSGNSKADTATIYRIGSLTKTFTTTLMILAKKGMLTLNDPLERYVPEAKMMQGYSPKTVITLKQLASHTAGLAREPDMSNASTGPVQEWEKKVLASIPFTKLVNQPGSKFTYSNIGFALLGLALERAASQPYVQLMQDYIFSPLAMKNTYFMIPYADTSRVAEGIHNYDKAILNKIQHIPSLQSALSEPYGGYAIPNNGLYSTTGDLALFLLALTNNRLIGPEDLVSLSVVPPGGSSYGLGVSVFNVKGLNAISHSGGVPGYKAQFFIDKLTHDGVILLRNYDTGSTNMGLTARKLVQQLVH